MFGVILKAILNDKDFFSRSVLQNDSAKGNTPRSLQPIYGLLREFFYRLTTEEREHISPIEEKSFRELREFLHMGLPLIKEEWEDYCRREPRFRKEQEELAEFLNSSAKNTDALEKVRRIQRVFFPQGSDLWDEERRSEEEQKLRARRTVKITRPNPAPIADPVREILFTSNILVTLPLPGADENLQPDFKKRVNDVRNEEQKYWYDHPIPLGIDSAKNEALYGMRGLVDMLRFEKERGNVAGETRLTCLLSASTTHDGLHDLVKDYFEGEFRAAGNWEDVDIYLFSETDCRLLIDEVLRPLSDIYFPQKDAEGLYDIFGVDGEYGRHYSFLKAVAALWQVFVNPQIKATFKIDLDQVFDQETLLRETGQTALQLFKTPLWGAEAEDYRGRPVHLGMIAGALVNHDDIEKSLFTPDVTYPDNTAPRGDRLVFYSRLPQALSTKAEMMCRYDGQDIDGKRKALQRIHVTGGTNGVLIDALRRYRPFTPTDIGRAEDQAYLLSVLFEKKPYLRYVHRAGLVMRHDKEAFAREAIRAAQVGKMIGDYVRILQFTFYARALAWPLKETKEMVDPFTGSFITELPFTIVYLRFTFKLLALLEENAQEQAIEFAELGSRRLSAWVGKLSSEKNTWPEKIQRERQAWQLYYDILDRAEQGLAEQDRRVEEIKEKARQIIQQCRLDIWQKS
ncbi:MAG TPA: hypothetical protein ENK44_06890 [Caldithrix abyssi]|uniref:SPOC domain-containing protein n=1 Tax=Caldithrix abyssi TaxID=187145 RepID=A0A7V4TZS8_CALAY|nr:hypothetical protein [Caldithrix abyssi]